MSNLDANQKSIVGAIVVLVLVIAFTYFKLHPQVAGISVVANTDCTDDQSCYGANFHAGITIGNCRDCLPLRSTKIPFTNDIGEYVDFKLASKLGRLAAINSNWRLTEAYPPTVKHLSFCHQNGTCVDLGLYPEKRTSKNLSQLCKDALRVGLTIVNEYSDTSLFSVDSLCPDSNIFETTTGGHLHVQ